MITSAAEKSVCLKQQTQFRSGCNNRENPIFLFWFFTGRVLICDSIFKFYMLHSKCWSIIMQANSHKEYHGEKLSHHCSEFMMIIKNNSTFITLHYLKISSSYIPHVITRYVTTTIAGFHWSVAAAARAHI